jgi:hypothetical protein
MATIAGAEDRLVGILDLWLRERGVHRRALERAGRGYESDRFGTPLRLVHLGMRSGFSLFDDLRPKVRESPRIRDDI